jgi:enamine deaminase RidA (YjgF/YER057c/UK114 family)
MSSSQKTETAAATTTTLSAGERSEMGALGLLDEAGKPLALPTKPAPEPRHARVVRRAITNPEVLNEAYHYEPLTVSFSRGLRADLRSGTSLLFISGTASVDEKGATIHKGDFRAQCWRTYRNITELLRSEGASWKDVIRTTCYLRDIERDYDDFNEIRNHFLSSQQLDPLPASTGIQARLCRDDLLVEIEAIAIVEDA